MVVGISGSIGSGKTTVASIFKQLGYPVYYSDLEAKKLLNNDDQLQKEIIDVFGEESYNEEGYDSVYIRSVLKTRPELLRLLNEIVHPCVKTHFLNWVSEQSSTIVFKESALLLSEKIEGVDQIIVVWSNKEEQIKRLKKRDENRSEEESLFLLEKQSYDFEDERVNYLIENSTGSRVLKKVLDVLSKIEFGLAN